MLHSFPKEKVEFHTSTIIIICLLSYSQSMALTFQWSLIQAHLAGLNLQKRRLHGLVWVDFQKEMSTSMIMVNFEIYCERGEFIPSYHVPITLNGIGTFNMLSFPANCAEVNVMPAEDILNMNHDCILHEDFI